jgi:hypothetical protein
MSGVSIGTIEPRAFSVVAFVGDFLPSFPSRLGAAAKPALKPMTRARKSLLLFIFNFLYEVF